MTRYLTILGLAIGLTLSAAAAQILEIEGRSEERTVDSVEAAWAEATRRSGRRWVGWQVDAAPSMTHGGRCRLVLGEGRQHRDGAWRSQPSREALVFAEIVDGQLRELQVGEASCRVDARGVELEIWNGVSTPDSFRWLDRVALAQSDEELREAAVAAIALHRLDVVDGRLEALARDDASEEVRHAALFWLGSSRGPAGYQALRRLETRVSDSDLEEALVFAYYVSEEPDANLRLLHLAREHRHSEVRSQALFWVAQAAGEEATATLERAVDDDPDREVREQAVFGLSQLPTERGIPALLRVARTHSDPEVREAAFFWLGQSGDPRALELFAEVLDAP